MSTPSSDTTAVTTAIIPASGFSTRWLPITAAFPKGFLPIGNRPAVDYVVDDLVRAGITDIHFVIHPFQRIQFEHYFQHYSELDAHLERKGKTAQLEELQALRQRARFNFIDDETKASATYGTAIPLKLALEAIGNLPAFMYVGADDFTVRDDGGNDMADLVAAFQRSSAEGALLGIEVPSAELKNYGVCVGNKEGETTWLQQLVEKPAEPEKLPAPRLANISKYIFTSAIRPFLEENQPNPQTNEHYITDVCEAFAADHRLTLVPATGRYYDVGTVESWQKANRDLGGLHG